MKMNYRKINEKVADKLTLSQIYGYYVLAMKSDYSTDESHINQTTLAELVGVNERTIKRWIKAYSDNGLLDIKTEHIKKDSKQSVKKNTYYLNTETYKLIGDGLLNLDCSIELKGFLILLKCRCFNCTNIIKYSQRELAKTCAISHPTISFYLNKCLELGFIKEVDGGYELVNTEIFIPHKQSLYYSVLKNYPAILTDEDIECHKIFNNKEEYLKYCNSL